MSRPTISPSWARRCSATPTAPTAPTPRCHRAPTSPVMIHTNACLVPPMPHSPPQTREITCAAIYPSAGALRRRSRRYRRAPRCRPPRARSAAAAAAPATRRASPTALPATAATTIFQVRDKSRTRKRLANYPGVSQSFCSSFSRCYIGVLCVTKYINKLVVF